jgi:Ca2+-binding EF-hand superfamily protein
MATRRSIVAMTIPLDIQQEEEGKPKVQESREKLINDIFDMYDLDRDGKIKSSEVRELLYSMGREPTNEDVMEFLKIADPENTGNISKEQFMDALKELYSVPDIDCDDVVEAFTVFDTDNDGKITFKDFKNILERYGTDLSSEEINSILSIITLDKDKLLDYEDFVKAWKFQ